MNKKVLVPRCVTLIIKSELSSVPSESSFENNRNSTFRNLSQKLFNNIMENGAFALWEQMLHFP